MDARSLFAAQSYLAQRPATTPGETGPSAIKAVGQAADSFAATLRQSETVSQQAMVGQADPHMLVQALAQSELAVETVVAVRNKVVEAYQEILRMPV